MLAFVNPPSSPHLSASVQGQRGGQRGGPAAGRLAPLRPHFHVHARQGASNCTLVGRFPAFEHPGVALPTQPHRGHLCQRPSLSVAKRWPTIAGRRVLLGGLVHPRRGRLRHDPLLRQAGELLLAKLIFVLVGVAARCTPRVWWSSAFCFDELVCRTLIFFSCPSLRLWR